MISVEAYQACCNFFQFFLKGINLCLILILWLQSGKKIPLKIEKDKVAGLSGLNAGRLEIPSLKIGY
jgi:hypothetical protein